jgi:tetratricopeptide (TPR) repeat protein
MMANRIIAHVFLQASLHQVDQSLMEKVLQEHPYFSAARILLARKVYQQTGDLQNSAIKKALVYTSHPHYGYHLIMEDPVLIEVEDRIAPTIPEDGLPGDNFSEEINNTVILEEAEAPTGQEALPVFPEASPVRELLPEEELPEVEDRILPTLPEDNLPEPATEVAVLPQEELPQAENSLPETADDEAIQPQEEENNAEDFNEAAAQTAATDYGNVNKAFEEKIGITVKPPAEALPVFLASGWETNISEPAVTEAPAQEPQQNRQTGTALQEQEEETITSEPVAESTEGTGLELESSTPLDASLETEYKENEALDTAVEEEGIKAVAEPEDNAANKGGIRIFPLNMNQTEETELIFQPLYTDDYFAYKRLKHPEEADELNAQGAAEMRSFTSWLRRMKEDFVAKGSKDWYQQQLNKIYDEDEKPEISETVEKMAVNSLTFNNDIVSETLAEICAKQKQYDNAIKIYQKLSLLNPDKNAYFAQKILELKTLTDKNK